VGAKEPRFKVSERRLRSGERIVLVTNGITGRHLEGGGTFGLDGLRNAIENAAAPTAACTAMAIQQAVTDCWREPLEDDGTVVVMAVA
jgi:serine phosphatase RsbU (regulator of sigma subunit)